MAQKGNSSAVLLESEFEEEGISDELKRTLLLEPNTSSPWQPQQTQEPPPKTIVPEPGFCVKTKTDKEEKVFINVCKSEKIPSPKDITDEQLQSILQSGDATQYRVPLSLGEPHTEKDHNGQDCTVYDVIISNGFYDTIQSRPLMKDFLLTIVLEGFEEKYSIRLCRECKIMKNRKFMGTLPEQTVRGKSKPFIIEMSEEEQKKSSTSKSPKDKAADKKQSIPEPEYTIIREPEDGNVPEYLVMEIKLPNVASSQALTLDISEDRVVLAAKPNLYHLDIDLPYTVESTEAGAQFNKDSRILFVTLPVNGIVIYDD